MRVIFRRRPSQISLADARALVTMPNLRTLLRLVPAGHFTVMSDSR